MSSNHRLSAGAWTLNLLSTCTFRTLSEFPEPPLGVHIVAHGPNTAHPMDIEIDLETLSQKTTRMRVVVKRGVVQKDAATASEIIAVTTQRLHYPPKDLAPTNM